MPVSFPSLLATPYVSHALMTLGLIATLITLRVVLIRAVLRREDTSYDARLRWKISIRTGFWVLLVVGLFVLWATEIRSVALSFAALAVAGVIATKELILCLQGGLLRSSDRPFSIGDRIEVAHFRGDVVDQSLFTTTVLEIGPGQSSHQYTGRAVVIPNSVLLNQPVINETYTDDFVLHVFTVPLTVHDDWKQAEEVLLLAAHEECRPFLEKARNYMKRLGRDRGLDAPTVDPRVSVHMPESGKLNLLVRIPAPARRKGRVEQAILRRFLERYSGFDGRGVERNRASEVRREVGRGEGMSLA